MPRSRRGSGLLAGGALVVLSVGVTAGILVASERPPRDVDPAAAETEVEVERSEFVESREAELVVAPMPVAEVTSPVGGLVTSTTCDPADPLTSGTSRTTVDDQPLILLASSRPLWRDLEIGDEGPDVTALQEELRRLGRDVRVDGSFGRQTLRQVRMLAESVGRESGGWEALPNEAFVWIPAPSVAVSLCAARVGDRLEAGGVLARLSTSAASARVGTDLDDLADWEVQLDGEVFPLTGTGDIESAEDLARLMRTPSYLSSASVGGQPGSPPTTGNQAEVTIAVELRRARPVPAYMVPPSALYGIRGDRACVVAGNRPTPVTILGSRLGKTYVAAAEQSKLSRVELDPGGGRPCG